MKVFLQKFIIISLFCIFLTCNACSPAFGNKPIETTAYKLNTIVTITIYDKKDPAILEEALKICDQYDLLFSRTNPDSQLYQLNHGLLPKDQNGFYTISAETFALLQKGTYYASISDNSFNLALAPLTSLWNFTDADPKVPKASSIQSVLPLLDSNNIKLQAPDKIAFLKENMGIDLGGIAKGYIADKIKEYLVSQGVESATISLGGNVLCIGDKSGSPFTIGIQRPFADRNETIATMKITDKSVVSSGIYERFFESDGKIYHHILNCKTGYPYENDLVSVTIVTASSTDADALSTTCFSLGLKNGLALANQLPDVDAVFITKDGSIYYTDEFEAHYQVTLSK